MRSRPEPAEEANWLATSKSTPEELRRAGIWAASQIRQRRPDDPRTEVRLDVPELLREIGVVADPLALQRHDQYGSRVKSHRRKENAR